jgi:hypothetical protein
MPDEKDMCRGGAYAEGGPVDSDNEMMMDQCAMECMDAIEKKNKDSFRDSFQVLVADLLSKMGTEPKE